MQVTKEGIERIKSANELSAVIAERGIEVKKKGRVLVARCPFHEEKTPSFTITPAKGLYHCFGCGAAGDVIGFVTKYDQVSFGGASTPWRGARGSTSRSSWRSARASCRRRRCRR